MFFKPYMIQEYFYCKNKTYITKNNLYKSDNKYIQIGNIIDEDNQKIKFNGFEIDGLDKKRKEILEVKKTCTNFEGIKYQLIYYIFLLKKLYKSYTGRIICKESKKEYKINPQEEDFIKLKKILNAIEDIDSFDVSLKKKEKCEKCGYFDFCFS